MNHPARRSPSAFAALTLAVGLAAQGVVVHSAPQVARVQVVAAPPAGPDVPPPPRAVGIALPHRHLPVPEGVATRPQPASPPTLPVVPHGAPGAPGQFRMFTNSVVAPAGASISGGTGEPTAVVNRDTCLFTGNWFAALSGDAGATWTRLNPYTRFPALDGGFCCDQRTLQVDNPNLTFWLLEYSYSATTRAGSLRIAFARGRDELRNDQWSYFDLAPQTFGLGNDRFLDYSDLCAGSSHLYGSCIIGNATTGLADGLLLWRASLQEIQNGGTVNLPFFTSATLGGYGSYRFAQGASNPMFFAAHAATAWLRVFEWSATNASPTSINRAVATWSGTPTPAPGPDGRDWTGFRYTNDCVLSGYANAAEVGFAWTSGAIAGRPRNFVRFARFRTSDRALIAEHDIWHTDVAYHFPSCATNAQGEVGGTVVYGGGTFFPSVAAFIVDNYTPWSAFALNAFQPGAAGPAANRWGDYMWTTRHALHPDTWVATSFALRTPTGSIEPHFGWFGRDDDEPGWVDLTVTTAGATPRVQIEQTDRNGLRDGTPTFTRTYAPRQGLRLSAPAQLVIGGLVYPLDRWVWNGVLQTPGVAVLDIDDLGWQRQQTAEVRYVVPVTLRVSSLPGPGAFVQVSPNDLGDSGSGTTTFNRGYRPSTAVTLTAPVQLGSDVFSNWALNGVPQPYGQRTISVTMTGFVDAVAQYVPAALLDVSSFPVTGVPISVSPLDLNSQGNGTTPFSRRYNGGTQATLTAPATFGTETFAQWLVQGGPRPPGQASIQVTVNLVQFCVAVYVRPGGGLVWAQSTPSASPGPRSDPGMVFDPARNRMVLFGGSGLADTWEYDGTTWTQRAPAVAPSGRGLFAMAHDPRRGVTVVFGGSASGALRSDTWEYDGTTWAQRLPATSPNGRWGAVMAYDGQNGRIVLFGGTNNQVHLDDTWEWDGATWTQHFPANRPPARRSQGMADDPVRRRVVLFGGRSSASAALNDTWEWDGSDWTQRIPAASPPVRSNPGVAFDRNRARMIVHGGQGSGGQLGDTWEWDGTRWAQRVTLGTPGPRSGPGMAFDAVRGRAVLLGGFNGFLLNDTWEYFAACDVVGEGHPGGGLPLTCTTAPVLGTNFCLAFPSALGSGVLGVGVAPPLSPPLPIAPPLSCAPGAMFTVPIAVLTANGNPANVCIPLAANAALHGAAVILQGFAVEAGPCLRATDALAVVLQKP